MTSPFLSHTGTKCLYFNMEWMNFTTARQVCKKMGSKMDLASIHSAAEQGVYRQLKKTGGEFMILARKQAECILL